MILGRSTPAPSLLHYKQNSATLAELVDDTFPPVLYFNWV